MMFGAQIRYEQIAKDRNKGNMPLWEQEQEQAAGLAQLVERLTVEQ